MNELLVLLSLLVLLLAVLPAPLVLAPPALLVAAISRSPPLPALLVSLVSTRS
jgi:hypothetical protein